MDMKKILWPTDFSSSAEAALPHVQSLTEKYQAEIHVLYVIEDTAHHEGWYGDFDKAHVDKLMERGEKTAQKRLDQICEKYLEGCPLYIKHIAVGDPAREILDLIDTEKIDMVVPVPLHIRREKARGYNQVFLLVKGWSRLIRTLNIGAAPIMIDRRVLVRNRWTDPQTGLRRKKRLENLKNAFSIIDAAAVTEKRILLVDDVYTTGATVNECSRVLLRAGAKQVDVLTLARAV